MKGNAMNLKSTFVDKRSYLLSVLFAVPLVLAACGSSPDPEPQPGEPTGTSTAPYDGCPGTDEPCTCTGGPHNGQCTCTHSREQCFNFCNGTGFGDGPCG
jgi:hypothetical protein